MELGFPCGLDGKESSCSARDLCLIPGLGRSPGEGKGYPLQYSGLKNSMDCNRVAKSLTQVSNFHFHPLQYSFLGFPGGSDVRESDCNAVDLGSIPGLGRSPGEGKGYPLHYSGLENSMDCIVHGVAKSRT